MNITPLTGARIAAVAIAGVLALGLSGCGQGQASAPAQIRQSSQQDAAPTAPAVAPSREHVQCGHGSCAR